MQIMLNSPEGWFFIVDSAILMLSLFGNCLALYGVCNARFRLMGYRRFLISLVVGDLFLISVHLFDKANQIMVAESMSRCCRCATFLIRSLLLVGIFVNLFNLCGMSVDHYIGIVYPLRYRYMMRKPLARWVLLFIWLGAICCGFADTPILAMAYYNEQNSPDTVSMFGGSALFAHRLPTFLASRNASALLSELINEIRNRSLGYYREEQTNWCLYFGSRQKWLELVSGLCVVLSFAFITGFYGRTFNKASIALNSRSIRKLILTTCLLLGVFAICWLPFALVELVMGLSTLRSFSQAHNESLLIVHKIFYTFFLLNRVFDPIVYVARLPNVQRFLLRRLEVCFPSLTRYLSTANSEERSERNAAPANNNNNSIPADRLTLHGSVRSHYGAGTQVVKDDLC